MSDIFNNNNSGQVVDLKKMREPESKAEIAPAKKAKGEFFAFNLFRKREKTHRVDFYRHYKNLEKKEDFVEREILKEYLNDDEEEKKQNILVSFFNFITRVLKLWWLPLFIIRFIWILFWRIGKLVFFRGRRSEEQRTKNKERQRFIRSKIEGKRKIAKDKIVSLEGAARSGGFLIFWQALWSIPREIMNFLSGRTTEDYLYQRVLAEEMRKKKFHPFRHIFTFVFWSLLFILPLAAFNLYNAVGINDLRGKVLGATDRAIGDLQSAAAAATGLDLKSASDSFSSARESFTQANEDLNAVSGIIFELGKIIPNDQIRLAAQSREIISAGTAAASLGNNLTLAINSLLEKNDKTLSEKIDAFIQYEILAQTDAENINAEVAKIDIDVLPAEYRDQFISLKQKSSDLELILAKNIDLIKKMNIFLGSEQDKRYLLIFEDNAEMRASGGFVGSYALLDLSRGKITNIEAPPGGSYDTKGGMDRFITPPRPLTLINPRWYFWDSNWWPDWEKSAQKLSWFYAKSGGPTTDGVIAFTPTVLQRILEITGPIDMTDVNGMVMTSDNLWTNMRTLIENEKAADAKLPYNLAENKPKKVIGQLTQKLMAEIPDRLDRDKFVKLLSGLQLDLNEKQILLYLNDSDLQAEAEARNWAGRIKDTNKDYLLVADTNIAGGKSDRLMTEKIDQRADVQPDGTIIDTLTIARTNTASSSQIFSGERNVDWLRIYVPAGSVLLETSGWQAPDPIYFTVTDPAWEKDADVVAEEGDNAVINGAKASTTIYNDSGKTVFANWSMVDPGQTAVITIKYQLPFKLEIKPVPSAERPGMEGMIDKMVRAENKNQLVYSLLAQKQPGALNTSISSALNLPANFKIDWNYPATLTVGANGWQVSDKLDTDKYWAVVIENSQN
ncbi:MAG: DUF4012 domain-containing protein [Patescibacteria group bacterium]|nr:DUF4012 domain-containing protein [Patescibacteria group bacterium]